MHMQTTQRAMKSSNLLFPLLLYHVIVLFWKMGRVPRNTLIKALVLTKCTSRLPVDTILCPRHCLFLRALLFCFLFSFSFWGATCSPFSPCCGAASCLQSFIVKCGGGGIGLKESILPALKVSYALPRAPPQHFSQHPPVLLPKFIKNDPTLESHSDTTENRHLEGKVLSWNLVKHQIAEAL